MSTKLVVIDVDGTLLNDRLVLSRKTKEILSAVQQKDVCVVLASGRPWRSMQGFYEEIGCKGPVICYNGAHVFDPSDESFPELKKTFLKDVVIDIAKRSQRIATSFMCEGDRRIYLKRDDLYLNKYFPYRNQDYVIGPVEKTLAEDVYTMLFRHAHSRSLEMKEIVESHPLVKYRHWTNSFYAEAYLEGTDKGSALTFIMSHYHFAKEDVLAFGDSDNDFGMLHSAGLAFAVKDCKSLLLSQSFPSTKKGNNQDGVALMLKELFL